MPTDQFEPASGPEPSISKRNCVFCEILAGEKPGRIIYQDGQVTAFWDAHPAADVHILIIPNRHIASINELQAGDEGLAGHLILTARRIAREQGIDQNGYRLIANTGRPAGQTVDHLHLHLLSTSLKRPTG